MNGTNEQLMLEMRLKDVSLMIESNIEVATRLRLTLHWGFVKEKIVASIRFGEKTIHQKTYYGKHTHVHLAQMHLDWNDKLAQLTEQVRKAEYARRASTPLKIPSIERKLRERDR
ncbi:hypothetical protein ACFPVY_03995 [Flavobacterium qiangtangense]|uniref:Uncharacterized protein n=1 Tax=Flavobacterium qiangtangense TaxID=1442595 RepID=A0ABW1PJS9_9FLAO